MAKTELRVKRFVYGDTARVWKVIHNKKPLR